MLAAPYTRAQEEDSDRAMRMALGTPRRDSCIQDRLRSSGQNVEVHQRDNAVTCTRSVKLRKSIKWQGVAQVPFTGPAFYAAERQGVFQRRLTARAARVESSPLHQGWAPSLRPIFMRTRGFC